MSKVLSFASHLLHGCFDDFPTMYAMIMMKHILYLYQSWA